MNNVTVEKPVTIKYKTVILILSLISIILYILSFIPNYFKEQIFELINGFYFEEIFNLYSLGNTPDLSSTIYSLITLATLILFVLYIINIHKKKCSKIIIPTIFSIMTITYIWDFIYIISYYDDTVSTVAAILPKITFVIIFVLLTLNAFRGLANKKLLTILLIIHIILYIFSILFTVYTIITFDYIYWDDITIFFGILPIFNYLSLVVFSTALLIFGLNNRIPAILSATQERVNKKVKTLNSEQAIKLLQDKLELGIITEEEYQTQVNKILDD